MTSLSIHDAAAADWSPLVGSYGALVEGVEDIAQCLRIILLTPKGSVPHRPTFGCDAWSALDQPLAIARPVIVREALDAIATWEPRAQVVRCTVSVDVLLPEQLLVRVSWRPVTGGDLVVTTIPLAQAA